MPGNSVLTHAQLKTPKAAAIAGIGFSLLLLLILWLLRTSIPADPLEAGAWLATDTRAITVALNLVPFAGVAFIWFIGVVRNRLGQFEDRFFASVFFGSALLFLAMLFAAAAVIGAVMLVASVSEPNELISSATFRFARAVSYIIMNVYAIKMAAVFIPSGVTGSRAKTRPNRCGCINNIRAAMIPPVECVARWQNGMFSESSAASI